MGIRFLCPTCGAKLNVKAELAGKRGACPKCQAKILIPTESSDASAEHVAAPVAVAAGPASPAPSPAPPPPPAPTTSAGGEARWFVRPPSGGQYGPALETVLRQWITEGRITPDTLIWREGDPEWQKASQAFSQLGAGFAAPVSAPTPTPAAVKPAPVAPMKPAPVGVALEASSTAKSEIDASTAAAAMLLARRKRSRTTALMIMGGLIIAVLILLPILIYVLTSQGAPPEDTPAEARNRPAMVDILVLPA